MLWPSKIAFKNIYFSLPSRSVTSAATCNFDKNVKLKINRNLTFNNFIYIGQREFSELFEWPRFPMSLDDLFKNTSLNRESQKKNDRPSNTLV